MMFVLCNIRLSICRYYRMNRGTMCAPFSAAGAPWEPAWIQNMIAGITASHAAVGQPLLRVPSVWRSQAHPCPAQLCCEPAWPWEGALLGGHRAQVVPSSCNCSPGWRVNTLHWTWAGCVLCGPHPPLVCSYRLIAAGRKAHPEGAEQYQAWNWVGILLIHALQERVGCAESKEREGCTLCLG